MIEFVYEGRVARGQHGVHCPPTFVYMYCTFSHTCIVPHMFSHTCIVPHLPASHLCFSDVARVL